MPLHPGDPSPSLLNLSSSTILQMTNGVGEERREKVGTVLWMGPPASLQTPGRGDPAVSVLGTAAALWPPFPLPLRRGSTTNMVLRCSAHLLFKLWRRARQLSVSLLQCTQAVLQYTSTPSSFIVPPSSLCALGCGRRSRVLLPLVRLQLTPCTSGQHAVSMCIFAVQWMYVSVRSAFCCAREDVCMFMPVLS